MRNASSTVTETGPNTPGAPASMGTPNASYGKLAPSIIVSPQTGKGAGQLPMNSGLALKNPPNKTQKNPPRKTDKTQPQVGFKFIF